MSDTQPKSELVHHDEVVTVQGNGAEYAQQIQVGVHCLTADEPASLGGGNTGPSPYDLLLGALGSCTSITITMYAKRKEWPLENVTVRLLHRKEFDDGGKRSDLIEREIELIGELTIEQRVRLLDVAGRCPIHRTLLTSVKILTTSR